jgi:tape measure domain-containing protein
MALAGSLLVSLAAKTDEFERGMNRAQHVVGTFGSAVTGLAAGVVSFEALRRGITAVIEAGDGLRQTERLFTLVKGNAEAGAASLQFVRQAARELGQEFDTLQRSYVNITASGKGTVLQGEGIDTIFRQVSASAAALGKTTAETDGIFVAFGQILSKGKITAEDFNQIAERFPGALSIAARALRVTTQEFVTMREAGQLMTSDLAKIANQMNEEIGKKGATGIESAAKSWIHLKNATTEVLEELDKFGVSKGAQVLLNLATEMAKGMRLLSNDVRQATGIGTDKTLPEVRGLQARYPGANVMEDPAAVALRQTVADLQKAQALLAQIQPMLGVQVSEFDRVPLEALQAEVTRLNYLYQVQFETLAKIGEVSQQQARAGLENPAIDKATQLKDATLLQAELAQRLEGVTSAMAAFDQRAMLGADAAEMQKEKIQALSKALQEMQGILARPSSQELMPLLQGGSMQAPIRNIPLDRWQAQIPLIREVGQQVGVDPALIAAVMARESSFNPRAISPAGAQGLMQLMPETQQRQGVTNPFDPRQNIVGGAMELRDLMRRQQGNIPRVLAGYNSSDAVHGAERFPETRAFVKVVQENYALLRAGVEDAQGGILGQLQRLTTLRNALMGLPDYAQRDIAEEDMSAVVPENERLPLGYAYGAGRFSSVGESNDENAPVRVPQDLRLPMDFGIVGFTERQQIARDEAQSVFAMTEALAAQRDQLSLSTDQLLRQTLAKQGASEATINFASDLQREVLAMQTAAQAASLVENALIDMATGGDVSLARLGQAFGRLALQIAFEASGIRQSLTEVFSKAGLAIAGAIGGTPGAADVTGLATPGLETSGLFAGMGKAGGGDVVAGYGYMVGEHGPEPFFPAMDGTVLSHEEMIWGRGDGKPAMTGNTFNFSFPHADVSSFLQSQGAIERKIAQAVRNSTRWL